MSNQKWQADWYRCNPKKWALTDGEICAQKGVTLVRGLLGPKMRPVATGQNLLALLERARAGMLIIATPFSFALLEGVQLNVK